MVPVFLWFRLHDSSRTEGQTPLQLVLLLLLSLFSPSAFQQKAFVGLVASTMAASVASGSGLGHDAANGGLGRLG